MAILLLALSACSGKGAAQDPEATSSRPAAQTQQTTPAVTALIASPDSAPVRLSQGVSRDDLLIAYGWNLGVGQEHYSAMSAVANVSSGNLTVVSAEPIVGDGVVPGVVLIGELNVGASMGSTHDAPPGVDRGATPEEPKPAEGYVLPSDNSREWVVIVSAMLKAEAGAIYGATLTVEDGRQTYRVTVPTATVLCTGTDEDAPCQDALGLARTELEELLEI